MASHLASLMLDGVGHIHFREGVVLITENQRFLTEEACSGIRSLFSSLAGIGFYCILNYYGIWRIGFNLLQTLVWVMIGNALRIAIVVLVTDVWGSPVIATGTGHEVFGFVMFGFIMLMAISMDRLLVAWFLSDRKSSDSEAMDNLHKSDNAPFKARTEFPVIAIVLKIAFVGTFLVGSLISFNQFANAREGIWVNGLPRIQLPEQIDLRSEQWSIEGFEYIHRGKGNIQAEDSAIWTLSRNELITKFSADCPWDDWHDLSQCYSGLGWIVSSQHNFSPESSDSGYTILSLSRSTGETGMVIFSSVDRVGDEVVPRFTGGFFSLTSIYRQMMETLGKVFSNATDAKNIRVPVTTFQLICMPQKPLNESDQSQLIELFKECRASVLTSQRFSED